MCTQCLQAIGQFRQGATVSPRALPAWRAAVTEGGVHRRQIAPGRRGGGPHPGPGQTVNTRKLPRGYLAGRRTDIIAPPLH
jgi:hypothetical protein